MSFDSAPERPRDIWLHTIRGYIVALRVPNKPYPVLPGIDRCGLPGTGLARAVYEQTGLVIAGPVCVDGGQRHQVKVYDSEVLAGSLRASLHGTPELVHPSEFKMSPEVDDLGALLIESDPPALSYAEVSVRPEDLMIGDRTALLITGVRVESTDNGPVVSVQYENFVQATLGADDQPTPGAFGDEAAAPADAGEAKDATRSDSRRGKPAAIGDPARASRVWTPVNGGAGLRVYRLGGSLLGPST